MLDVDTKRRIDTARDILVGKVPDPKSQVEQITIALIYKFMDDIDADAEELGGQRQFFAGDFERYGWPQLVRAGLGGHEVLNLYAEAIARMPENPGIPPLFRDIFNNAYLPYRDPETLRAFLKEIDSFRYDHSERLGDAFEYLLSVLGAQGDAGQFRTPRHIIDFMVAILDPKKDETILDPACGTAGFLVSSYKHILKANTDAEGHSTLTPDEKGKLATNFNGYDISPDMVRLSLVNLYLHGFVEPHIAEYDTLTSEDRWTEYADVILANPPFMSPKGGIRPHRRFSVQSKRSEVLFVDYMAEHLTPTGRAGIIVPEGIIFQSQTAHKQLRKMLVESYLVAVISLPAGVFQPYSGVKTSILILDKLLAKKTDRIIFFKVDNDGFDLGAQRRVIAENDLPQVRAEVAEYLGRLRAREPASVDHAAESGARHGADDPAMTHGLIAEKEKIATGGEYNLSGERYRQQTKLLHTKWKTVALGEICSFMTGGTPRSSVAEYFERGTIPWLVSGDIHQAEIRDCEKRITEKGVDNSNAKPLPTNSVLIALNGQGKTRGTVAMLRMEGATCNQSLVAINPLSTDTVIPEFIFWVLRSTYSDIRALTGDNERSGLNIPILKGIQIPLPPVEVQRDIVAEMESYRRVIDGAHTVIDNYQPQIVVDPEWPLAELGEACEITMGQSPPGVTYNTDGKGVPLINGPVEFGPEPFSKTVVNQYTTAPTKMCLKDDLIVCVRGATTGRMNIAGYSGCLGRGVAAIRCGASQPWVNYVINSLRYRIHQLGSGSTFPNITYKDLATLKIPMPALEIQQAVVAELEAERALVDGSRQLMELFEKKIQTAIGRIWGEDGGQGIASW